MKPKLSIACALLVGLALASVGASWVSAAPTSQPSPVQTVGDHRLFYKARLNNADRNVAYSIYLPPGYTDASKRWPMIVFLVGAGEAGDDHGAIYAHGPVAELTRNKELADKANYIVLTPQCPSGLRWDTPGLAEFVIEITNFAKSAWRVDADRVYLTGLSMGGRGTYHATIVSKGIFAAIAPISADDVFPDKVAAVCHDKTTVWIICGDSDGGFTEGSRRMTDALRKQKIDTVLTMVPGRGHDIWASYYPSRLFYDFLLAHRRGAPPPANRPTPEELLHIAYVDPKSVDAQLADPFKKFLPAWQLLNCGKDGDPGLKPDLAGRKNVFVTAPLDKANPCRMITALDVPAKLATRVELTVGARPGAPWDLTVLGNGESLLHKQIGAAAAQPAKDGVVAWQNVSADLSRFAGQSVRVQVLDGMCEPAGSVASAGSGGSAACWGTIAVRSEQPAQVASVAPTPATPAPVVAKSADDDEVRARGNLNLAETYKAGGLTDRAKEFLQQVIHDYPKTKAAKEAKDRLETWGLK
jgi:hypothetical protein